MESKRKKSNSFLKEIMKLDKKKRILLKRKQKKVRNIKRKRRIEIIRIKK